MVEETDTPETASEWLEVTWQVHCRARRSSLPLPASLHGVLSTPFGPS